jgi:hypothetical protein
MSKVIRRHPIALVRHADAGRIRHVESGLMRQADAGLIRHADGASTPSRATETTWLADVGPPWPPRKIARP